MVVKLQAPFLPGSQTPSSQAQTTRHLRRDPLLENLKDLCRRQHLEMQTPECPHRKLAASTDEPTGKKQSERTNSPLANREVRRQHLKLTNQERAEQTLKSQEVNIRTKRSGRSWEVGLSCRSEGGYFLEACSDYLIENYTHVC